MRIFLRGIGLLGAVAVFGLVFHADTPAHATWPPTDPNADMTDQNNWPNDPGYADRWNYWSFLPKQDQGTQPYLGADLALGASGMSIDKAWALLASLDGKAMENGRQDVRIAVLDSGIEWDSSDIVNKVALNRAELANHKPQNAQGQACGGTGALAGYDCNGDGVFNVVDYKDDPRMTPIVTGDKCFQGMDPLQPSTTDRTAGDLNHNCLLDPGDLILRFSDGVDDDGNGYVDDIAGWDFYKNDNDPYDDTRYGHGTGEANDSSAEGNNNSSGIGTCPSCMFMPLRVGESFITDVNNFAKAAVYATDMGVKVIQEALGTINQTPFSRRAIDYAYAHGVLVDASMADENSRHHNMPATWNHTLPVHTIRYNGDNYHDSTTFLAFDSCTNYGGHSALSVSGVSCASEATGRTAGIAGLVYAMGRSLPQPIDLSAEEVMQLLKQGADDVNVPESKNIDPSTGLGPFYESKPGWDQRFNYGRINAFRALSMVKDGKIPPEVDVTSPTWYQPIYANRVGGTVAVVGTVAAKRATSYDYVVEWAPGVEPDDSQFQPLIAAIKNVPSSTVSGGPNAPLATFDPRQLDTKHDPDPDSQPRCNRDKTFCWGPNDRTVTLRVRATAHYGGFDQNGEARRTIAITNDLNGNDPDLLPGFPIDLGTSAEGSAKLADIDGDGIRDIVFGATDGTLHVYSLATGVPVEAPGFPFRTALIDGLNPAAAGPGVPSYLTATAYANGKNGGIDPDIARETIGSAPAVGDLDGDGKPEIVFSTWDGSMYVLDHTGKTLPGWPKRLPLVPSCPLDPAAPKPTGDCMDLHHAVARGAYAAPVLVDMDKDGKLDIVQAAFDAFIYAWHADGTAVSGWPVRVNSSKAEKMDRIMSTPTATDLNGDGIPELVTGSNETVGGGGGSGPVFAIDGRGMNTPSPQADGPYLPNWPITMTSLKLFPVVGTGVPPSQFAADFDNDGVEEIGIMGNGAPPLVLKANPGVQSGFSDPPNKVPANHVNPNTNQVEPGFDATAIFGPWTLAQPDTMFPILSQPAVGDLDQDGVPDPVMSGGSLSLIGSLAGGGIPHLAQFLLASWSGRTGKMLDGMPVVLEDFQFLAMPTVADISGDDYPETILGTGSYFIHAADACGVEAKGWPKFTNGWTIGAAAVGDVTGGGSLDVIATTREGYMFAWTTKGSSQGVVQWESFHHDNANTGSYAHTLDQGVYKRASGPPDCTPPSTLPPPQYDAGGCSCDVPQGSSRGALGFSGAVLGFALLMRRRRSSRRQPRSR
ncbi:MAG TPA: FG-GAP-like repeat-containing protein [Polyangiaceae bacterium]|nr:FG-GAP-like repeat-containing protein [Polyangiaceae bacterium]